MSEKNLVPRLVSGPLAGVLTGIFVCGASVIHPLDLRAQANTFWSATPDCPPGSKSIQLYKSQALCEPVKNGNRYVYPPQAGFCPGGYLYHYLSKYCFKLAGGNPPVKKVVPFTILGGSLQPYKQRLSIIANGSAQALGVLLKIKVFSG